MRADYAQRLMFNGILIFLIGLLMGFGLYFGLYPNGQIGLAAHLEGVLNGMFLSVLGLMWSRLLLSVAQQRLTITLALGSVYLNITQAIWWAVLGRSHTSPVFPADRAPIPPDALIMNIVLPALSVGFVACCVMVLWGLHRGMAAARAASVPGREAAL